MFRLVNFTIIVVVLLVILIVYSAWPVRSSSDERRARRGEHRRRWDGSNFRYRYRRLWQLAEHHARRQLAASIWRWCAARRSTHHFAIVAAIYKNDYNQESGQNKERERQRGRTIEWMSVNCFFFSLREMCVVCVVREVWGIETIRWKPVYRNC